MKLIFGVCALLSLVVALPAQEIWLGVSPFYGRPFRSPGYVGRASDGIGLQMRLEDSLGPHLAVGLGYGQLKVVQAVDTAYWSFSTASLRWTPFNWHSVLPYAQVEAGLVTNASSTMPQQTRSGGWLSQAGLGLLLENRDEPWAVDVGGSVLTAGPGAGFNFLQGHMGLLVRFGMENPVGSDLRQGSPPGL